MYSVQETKDFIGQMPNSDDDTVATTLLIFLRIGKITVEIADQTAYDLGILKVTNLEFWEQTHNLT